MLNESSAFVKGELQRGQIFIFFERKISEKTASQERQEYINKIERLLTGSISDLGELASYEFESFVYEYKIGGVYDI